MIKLSIVVPIYNVEKYLSKCVESIINSSYSNIEVILVDDGSLDQCGQICDELAAQDGRIKVIHKENGGLVSARKAGAKIATGEYLTFVDGDDWVAPDWYKKAIRDIKKSDADIYISGLYEYRDGKTKEVVNELETGLYIKDEKWEDIFTAVLCDERMRRACIPGIVVKILKTELFQKNMKDVDNSIRNSEDVLFSIVCMKNASSIQINNECIGYFYRIIEESMSHCYDEKYWEYIEAYNRNINKVLENCSSEKIKKRVISDRIYMILRYIDKELFYNKERFFYQKIKNLKRILEENATLKDALRAQKVRKLEISFKGKIVIILLRYKLLYLLYFLKCLGRKVRGENNKTR